jgi:hypothetical protein
MSGDMPCFASRLVLCGALALMLGGCAVAGTDLSAIAVGAPRETVESILGTPVRSVETEAGTTDIYRYDKGWTPAGKVVGVNCQHPGCVLLLPVAVIVAGLDYAENRDDRRGYVRITYGPDGTVVDRQTVGRPH